MADDKQVNIIIKSKYEGKGDVDAKKGLEKVEKQAQKTNEAMIKGADNTAQKIMTLSSAINIAKAAWAGVRGVVGWFMESIEMANKNARSVNMLAAAYNAVGYNAKGALDQAKAFATEMQNLTGIADEVFLDGQRLLANYGIVGQKAQESIRAAYALSVGIGTSMESALTLVAKAAAGSTSSLSRYGIVLGDNVKEGEKFDAVLKQINDKFGASAQASMGDMTAQVGALKESWGDLREELGNYLIPAFSTLVGWGQKAVGVLDNLFGNKRSADQIAYQKNLEKIAETNKQIEYWQSKAYNKAYNQNIVNDHLNKLAKELKFYQQTQEALDKQNYERAKQAKIDGEIREVQAEQINNARAINQATTERAKKEQEIANKLKEQLETFRQNAQQSSNERRVKFTADVAGANLSGLADIDNRLEQEHSLQEQLAAVREQALQEQVARVQAAADAETEIGQERISKALEQLEEFNAEQYILNEEYAQNREALDQRISESNQAVYEVQKFLDSQKVKDFSAGLNQMAQLQNSKSKELVAVGKAAGIAQATIDTAQGAIAAYQAMAHIPFIGPALGIAAAAALTAYGAERIAEIGGVKMADGGLVKAVTGGIPAVIGEGGSDEAVLPLDDSQAMRRIGGAIAEESGAVGGVTVNINVQAVGGVEAILEQLTDASRSGVVQALEFANLNYKVGAEQQGYSV